MADYISRQAAIIQLSHNKSRGDDEWMLAVESDMGVIKALPVADVVPVVHGYWKSYSGRRVEVSEEGYPLGECFCSVCGDWLVASDEYYVKGHFCPNCGAKMDGGDGHEAD